MKPKSTDWLRYALWLGVAYTANANRKHFGLPTTWVIHITINSFILFLPEIVRGTSTLFKRDTRTAQPDLARTIHATLRDAVVNNPYYALDVAPVPLAYIVSHPRLNIYKGDWAKLRFFGFGLDAIPHSTTALGFTNLVMDVLAAFRRNTPVNAGWLALAERAAEHSALVAGALLAAASALYESGEYAIHEEELRETGGDARRINMEWGVTDTIFDLCANALGWVTAVLLRPKRRVVGQRTSP